MNQSVLFNLLVDFVLVIAIVIVARKKGWLRKKSQPVEPPIVHKEGVTVVDFSRGDEVRQMIRKESTALLPQDIEGGVIRIQVHFVGNTSPRIRRLERLSGATNSVDVIMDALRYYEYYVLSSK
ncbi:MAG: hypothetical protein WC477_04250 [Patescibacteria group bacterium]